MRYSTKEFYLLISDLIKDPMVKNLQDFRQHYQTSRYEHCLQVAFLSYVICKKYNLDYKSAARAGLLHDLFLYDWRVREDGRKGLHGFTHPRVALNNALQICDLNIKEQDIILKHMWPLTVILPKYKESYIISLVDKYCTLNESYKHYKKKVVSKKTFRYAYVFFGLLLFKIY